MLEHCYISHHSYKHLRVAKSGKYGRWISLGPLTSLGGLRRRTPGAELGRIGAASPYARLCRGGVPERTG